jgi:THO complex subunit 2
MTTLPTAAQLETALRASDLATTTTQPLLTALVTSVASAEEIATLLTAAKESLLSNQAACTVLVDLLWLHTSLVPEPTATSTTTDDAPATTDNATLPSQAMTRLTAVATALPELHPRLLATLDAGSLQAAGVITSEADLSKKMRLTNTQQFYRQYKFNLLPEVAEGYAKFLRLVGRTSVDDAMTTLPDTLAQLMGTFCLDPHRCLDLALDVLAVRVGRAATLAAASDDDVATAVVRILRTDKTAALLAFKLNGRQSSDNDATSILRVIAYLVSRDLLDLPDMLTYFPAWDDVLAQVYREHRVKERKRITALGRVRLSSSSPIAVMTETVDLTPLALHMTSRLLVVCVEWNMWNKLESLFQDFWSDLCELFPTTIGKALCAWIAQEAQPVFAAVLPAGPWAEDKTMAEDGPSSVSDTITTLTKRLLYTKESGCIAQWPTLCCQLWRLVAHYLQTKQATAECLVLVQDFLLPATSAFPANPALNVQAWMALQQLPYRTRYTLYAAWRGTGLARKGLGSPGKPLWLTEGEILAGKDARYSLKRLSKDTIREASRALGKICHSRPLVVFSIILDQIESYDNMIQVMVDAMRFVAPLSLDILCFCILSRLSGGDGGVNRSRLKEDGVNVSQWLQSLETYIGALCKRFPSLEVRGIISYLIHRLAKGEVMELGVLRSLLKTSGGWAFADYAPAASLSATQLEGRAGSARLKRETMSFGVFEDFSSRASDAVRSVLQSDSFGTTLLVLLAQVHHQIIFEGQSRAKPIKLIGNLVDSCQATLSILLDFLADSPVENVMADTPITTAILNFARSIPPLTDLMGEFELDLPAVWMICRPLVRAAASLDKSKKKKSDGDLAAFEIGKETRKSYMALLPSQTWDAISCDLYEVFYTNTLFDIFLPEDSYQSEISRLEKEVDRLSKAKSETPTHNPQELQRMKTLITRLSSDLSKQRRHVKTRRTEIKEKVDSFFISKQVSTDAANAFFTSCIYPRCMQGPEDAMYCAQFVSMLHSFATPGFGTLELYGQIIVSLSRAVFGLTEGEAANVSILLQSVWKDVSRWRYDEESFREEVQDKAGSFFTLGDEGPISASFEVYSVLYNKWHASLGAAMLGCLQSSEYMHCRNSLVLLSRMVEEYPTRPTLANKLLSVLQPFQEEGYPFADIRASAQAYGTQLIKARDDGVWKEETEAAKGARKTKEQEAVAARQKKAEEQMEQLKRDSEKITEEIGERDSYDARGQGRRGAPRKDAPAPRDDRGQQEDHRGAPREEKRTPRRDAPSNAPPGGRPGREDGARKVDDRRPRVAEGRAGEASRGSKRSRPPSPTTEPAEGGRDEPSRTSKRQRTDAVEDGALMDDSGGRRGGRRGKFVRR